MLSLAQLTVTNYRSIKGETFPFRSLAVLIGRNNAGKTNVLDSIAVLLEGTSRDVTRQDFFDPATDYTIEGRFSGVEEYLDILDVRHKPRIKERIDDEGCITVRRVGYHSDYTLGKIEIREAESDAFGTPTGIDAALHQLLPEPIYVRPLADVADEVSGKASSALTKILAQIVDRVEAKAQPLLEEAYEKANALLNVTVDREDSTREIDNRLDELKKIEGRITEYLQETFPTSRARLNIPMPTVKQVIGNIEVLVNEGNLWKPYYRQGHGLQRVLLLSLLRALAFELRNAPESKVKRPFMLLIEEPELFLHPTGQEQMRDTLDTIANSSQVIYATHSPLLVSADCLSGLVRIEKSRKPGSMIEETSVVGTPVTEQELESEKDVLAILNLQRSSQLFFAATTVLVEGEGDRHLHRAIMEKMRGRSLEMDNIALVEVGGRDRFPRIKSLVRHFCPRVAAIADLDYVWTCAGDEIGSDPALSQLCEELKKRSDSELGDKSGIGEEELGKLRNECMKRHCVGDLCKKRDEVCRKLECLGTFVLPSGEIEDYVRLGKWAKGSYLNVAREIAAGERSLNSEKELFSLYARALGLNTRGSSEEGTTSG